jgi:uncharacterized protein (TIGR02145 family)/uncharacterized repeat protein (TIGR02543 family)
MLNNKKTHVQKFTGLLSYGAINTVICLVAASFFTCEKVPDHCGRLVRYNPEFEFCFEGEKYNLCAGNNFNPLIQDCDIDRNEIGRRCLNGNIVPIGTPCDGFTLSTAAAPPEGGSIIRTPDKMSYDAGEPVTVIATAEDGYRFAGWAGAETSISPNNITFRMDSNRPLVAMFEPISEPGATTHRLVTTAFPTHGGTITRDPDAATYDAGTVVTVTATVMSGHTFTGWSGASTSTDSTITVTVDEGKTLVAMFTPIEYTLTVNSNPEFGGTVFVNGTALAGASRQDAGRVEVLAQPTSGYVFVNWSGARTGTDNPMVIDNITSRDYTLTANFEQRAGQHTLAVSANDGGTATSSGTFNEGTNAPITATATGAGCTFTGWTGAGVADPSAASTTVSMTANRTVIANFHCISVPFIPGSACFVSQGNCFAIDNQTAWDNCVIGNRILSPATDARCQSGGNGDGHGHFNPAISYGSFTDDRDGQSYRTITIGSQTWMAENLNFNALGSWCYGNDANNCATYGRLYDWSTVMGLPSSCNITSCASQIQSSQGICPPGWHVPSDAEWTTLTSFVGSPAGTRLKALTGWSSTLIPGIDVHGFSALPGGYRYAVGTFSNVGVVGSWWSATEIDAANAQTRDMDSNLSDVGTRWIDKTFGFSLRCVELGRDCNFEAPEVVVIGANPATIGRPNLVQGSTELQYLMGGPSGFEFDDLLRVDGMLESAIADARVNGVDMYGPDGDYFHYTLGVVPPVGSYEIEYRVVRECSWNIVATTTVRRTVVIQTEGMDAEGQNRPISVALAGLPEVTVTIGDTYSDEGATATDGNGLPITRFVSVDIFLGGATTPIASSLTGGYPDGIPVNEIPLFVNTVFAWLTQEPASFRIVYEAASQIFGNPHTGSVTRTVNVTVHDPGTLPTIRIVLGQYTHNIDGLVISSPDTAVAFGNAPGGQTAYTSKGVSRAYYICGTMNTGCTPGEEVNVPIVPGLVTFPPTTLSNPIFRTHPRTYSIAVDPNGQYLAGQISRDVHVFEPLGAGSQCWPEDEPKGPPTITVTGANPLTLSAGVAWEAHWNGVSRVSGDCFAPPSFPVPYPYLIHYGELNPANPQPGQYIVTYVTLGTGTGYTATVTRTIIVQ